MSLSPAAPSAPRLVEPSSISRASHPRTSRASREEVRRTTKLALLLIGTGLVFAVLVTILFVRLA
jgi:hypothetical protein